MKNFVRGLLTVAAMASVISLNAQTATESTPTADEIVGKYVAAIGGKDAISQVKTISTESTVAVMGNEAPNTTVLMDGVGFKSETDFNGQKIIQSYTDKGGWMVNPMAGASDPTPVPDDQFKANRANIYVGGALYDYAARGSKVELMGKDADGYKIKLTTKDNVDSTYVIDPTTYLLKSVMTKGDMQGQEVEVTTKLSDYRKTDVGYMIPYTMDIDMGGQFGLTINVKKVELNKTVDPAVFEMPKVAAPATAPAAQQ
jgi:hypothetical protein